MSAIGPQGRLQHSPPTLPNPPGDGNLSDLAGRGRPSRMAPQIDRSRVAPEVLQAADGMEAMFLDYLLKVMRQTVPKGELETDSAATEIYRGMLDSEIAQKAAKTGGVGLSDQIIAYLESRSYTGNRGLNANVSPQVVATKYQAQQAQDEQQGVHIATHETPKEK